MASPDLRTAVRTGAAHLDRMAERLAAMERDGAGHRPRLRRAPPPVRDPRRLHARPAGRERADAGSGSRATSGRSRRRRCRAASRPGRRWPGWSSPIRTCCSSTSRPTTSTSTRSNGSRSTSAGGPARCSSRRTTGRSSTRRSTRVWELRDRRLTAFRGDYSAYHRQRVERDARTVKDVDTQAEQIAREKELIQRYRSHRKFSKQHEHEARLEKLEAERRDAPKAGPEAGDPDGRAGRRRRPVAQRRDRRPRRGPRGRLPARARRDGAGRLARDRGHGSSRAPRSWPPSAASGSGSSGRTAPARRRCCGRSPGTCRRSTARSPSGTRSRSATWPSCGARRSRARPSSTR